MESFEIALMQQQHDACGVLHGLPTETAQQASRPQRPLANQSRLRRLRLSAGHDTPGTDDVVGVTGEEGLAIGGPGEGDTLGLAGLLADVLELGLELVDLALLLEVEDDDAAGGGSAEPVAVGGEDEGVDLVVGVERVKVLALVEVPEHGGTVLATGSAEGAIGGDGDGVDVAGVTDVVGLELAGRELPNLFETVSRKILSKSHAVCDRSLDFRENQCV